MLPIQRLNPEEPYNGQEVCLLCGTAILCLYSATMTDNPLNVLEEAQWEIYCNEDPIPEHILVPSMEVENKGFSKFPWLSSCYYRAAVKSASFPKYASKYDLTLTGIGYIARIGGEPCHLPSDKNTARISGRKAAPQYDNTHFTQFYLESILGPLRRLKGKNTGYVFHSYCWEILGHLMGKEWIEEASGQVVRAATEYWNTHEGLGTFDPDVLFRAHELDGTAYVRYESYSHGCDIYINPWLVPEVHSAIQLAKEMVGKRKSSYFRRLPLEICLKVAEMVCPIGYTHFDMQNMRNMSSVFALDLPEAFWRRRLLKRDLFFELDLLETGSVDWQVLWLGLMGLLSDKWYNSSGLANRERVLRSIRGIIAIL